MSIEDDELLISEEEDIVPPHAQFDDPPPTSTSSKQRRRRTGSRRRLWQTQVREALSPYLPPPVVRYVRYKLDPQLKAYGAGPEGTVTMVTTLMLGFFLIQLMRILTRQLLFGSGKAIHGDDDDAVLASSRNGSQQQQQPLTNYNDTILLTGPSGSGKTRLFYRLCFGPDYSKLPTVASVKANVGYIPMENNKHKVVRCVDWPGMASLTDSVLESIMQETHRVVLVLDASQPVAPAADILYHLCTESSHNKSRRKPRKIFVACHKSDLTKAKNWRRIKIQIRTEMERLHSLRHSTSTTSTVPWWPVGQPLDLEQIPAVQLHFDSSSCESRLPPELIDFCLEGKLPEAKE